MHRTPGQRPRRAGILAAVSSWAVRQSPLPTANPNREISTGHSDDGSNRCAAGCSQWKRDIALFAGGAL